MTFFRSFAVVRSAALRPAASIAPRAQFHTVRALRQGDYGSGDGNPVGENPQQQGKRGREELEHPGPAPPKVGQNNKTSPNSDSFDSSSSGNSTTSESSSSSSQSSKAETTDKDVKGVKGAQPKILNENPPKQEEESQEVKQHNAEMDQRAEKAHEQVSNEDAEKDKVPKSFWSGELAWLMV
jgi:hypothetical protein